MRYDVCVYSLSINYFIQFCELFDNNQKQFQSGMIAYMYIQNGKMIHFLLSRLTLVTILSGWQSVFPTDFLTAVLIF